MKFRTCLLAVAGILGSSFALAQQPPATPPEGETPPPPTDPNAPAPPASGTPVAPPPTATTTPPPPGAPGAPPTAAQPTEAPQTAPTPAPAAPPPAAQPATPPSNAPPPVQFGISSGPTADTTTEEGPAKDAPPPLIWRGTTFTWNQAGTTQIFGIGGDYQGDEFFYYGWDFLLKPNIYLLDLPKDKINAFVEIGWNTELTDGDTVDKRETLFKDLQIGAQYKRSIWESTGREAGEYVTSGTLTTRLILPTSDASYTQGRYLVTAVGVGAKQQIKILGKKALGLNNVTIGPSLTWSHLFARSYQPTDPDLNRERQNASGQTFDSDVLSTKSYDPNRLTLGASISVPVIQDLTLATQFRYIANFKHDFGADGGCEVNVANEGCVAADRDPNRTTFVPGTTFDVALSYPIVEVVDVTLGYNNETRAIGEDGTRRNIFYSYDAQFYLDLTANLDVIYSKLTNRDKRPRATQWAKAEY